MIIITYVMDTRTRLHETALMSMARRLPSERELPVALDAGARKASLVKSAGRALQVLEFFDEVQREARVAEIADALGYPQSSTSVLLKCLTQLGHLDYDPVSRTFLPTPRVTLLGTWLDKGPVRNGTLTRMLEEISCKTGDTVILAARNGIYSHYVHVIQASRAMRFHVPRGSRRLVVWSATGFALLSGASADEIRALVLRTNAEASGERPPIDLRRVQSHVQRGRDEGHVFSKGLVTPGAGSIAVPLPSGIDRRERPLAVAVSGPLDDFIRREHAIVDMIRDALRRYLASGSIRTEPKKRSLRKR